MINLPDSCPSCPQCGSADTRWYDGALGYEAIQCHACHVETDANNQNNSGPFECSEHPEGGRQ